MFPFYFTNPWILTTAGAIGAAALVGVPILIHLINLLRHRKVEWAAMEFLLESQRKNSSWIMLKELILLLIRMLATAAVVALFGGMIFAGTLALLGGRETHHIIVLDDSYSMGERGLKDTPFDRARTVILEMAEQASREGTLQRFTILRTSQKLPDVSEELVRLKFRDELERQLGPWKPSQMSSGPSAGLGRVLDLMRKKKDDHRVVYLVSDFRSKEWKEADELAKTLESLDAQGAKVVLVNCAKAPQPNLAITNMRPVSRTLIAGVPAFMEVSVTNYGDLPANEVIIYLYEDGNSRPGEVIDRIKPGETQSRRFEVRFVTAGTHQLKAGLDSDVLEADNTRNLVLDFPTTMKVLLIDSSVASVSGGEDAKFLSFALNPGGPINTGYSPQIEPPSYLSNYPLEEFSSIYLANLETLDPKGAEALLNYVQQGGGLGIFLNENAIANYVTQELYRDGKGFFPAPLHSAADLLVLQLEETPDLQLDEQHTIFKYLAAERNSPINSVTVSHYLQLRPDWKAGKGNTTQVIAKLRNNDPLVLESRLGEGRVITFLTSAGPSWNDFVKNPSWVFLVQELQSYLAATSGKSPPQTLGTPWEVAFDATKYAPKVTLTRPTAEALDETSRVDGEPVEKLKNMLRVFYPQTDVSGVYRMQLDRVDGAPAEQRQVAYNVDATEGDLRTVSGQQLADRLGRLEYVLHQAEAFRWEGLGSANVRLLETILYALIALMLLEQLLAYLLGYHPTAPAGGRTT